MSELNAGDHTRDKLASVISEVIREYDRAKVKHGDNTLDGSQSNDVLRLAALVEEVGEAARELTYDRVDISVATVTNNELTLENAQQRLKKELIQVANVALTWASIL
jgi:KaiC/GvpD/RAD55 family RecA-like ATPase